MNEERNRVCPVEHLYFIPLTNQFLISLTVMDNEREMLLNDKEIDFRKELLKQTKKYKGGFVMQFQ